MHTHKQGQVLLIVALVLATIMTVILAASFKSSTETQVTKLQQDSQTALSAAEAGIEAALKNGYVGDYRTQTDLSSAGSLIKSTVSSIAAPTSSTEFVTRLLTTNEQYTFYLSSFPNATTANPDFVNPTPAVNNQNINICFGSEGTQPSLDITIIQLGGGIIKEAANPTSGSPTISGSGVKAASAPSGSACPTVDPTTNIPVTFASYVTINTGTNGVMLLVRPINASSKLAISRGASTATFPPQGKYVNSSATTTTNVTKKITLFQSYPQIPSDFFVTSF